MILKSFPERSLVESGTSSVVRRFGQENIVVNAKSRDNEYHNLLGPLSLKYTISGAEWYQVEGTELSIDMDNLLVLNNQQTYSTHISSESEVESFCFFFKNGLFEEVYTELVKSPLELLDDPYGLKRPPFDFIEKRYRVSPVMKQQLKRLKQEVDSNDSEFCDLDEHAYGLMLSLLSLYKETKREINKMPCVRKNTRDEVYRRVSRARDFIDSFLTESINLDEVAEVACMSKYHFLRSFKSVYKMPPHQYIIQQRMEKAREMVLNDVPVHEVCWAVGLSNQYSFSRLFKKHFGLAPTHLRQKSK